MLYAAMSEGKAVRQEMQSRIFMLFWILSLLLSILLHPIGSNDPFKLWTSFSSAIWHACCFRFRWRPSLGPPPQATIMRWLTNDNLYQPIDNFKPEYIDYSVNFSCVMVSWEVTEVDGVQWYAIPCLFGRVSFTFNVDCWRFAAVVSQQRP